MWARTRSWLLALTRRARFEASMREELQLHIEEYTETLIADGMAPVEAARLARQEFGSVDAVKAECRDARGLSLADELRRTVGFAVRMLGKTPGVTATALATFALCIGANLVIFAGVDAVLLRPLPFAGADRLVRVFNTYPKAAVPDDGSSLTNYVERRNRIAAFQSLSIYREGTAIVGESGATDREWVTRVSPEFFTTLAVQPAIGRAFATSDTTNEPVAIVTDAFWRQHLDADPHPVGQAIRIDGVRVTVIGVLPASYRFLSSKATIYVPLRIRPEDGGPERRHWGSSTHMLGRLGPSRTVQEAQAQIDAHNAAVESTSAQAARMAEAGFRSVVVPLHADHVAAIRPALLLVQAGAFCLLLIGIVNLANLLLIRFSGRARQLAIRQAIGASRARIVVDVVTETMVLFLSGALCGLGVAAIGTRALSLLGTEHFPLGSRIAFDARVAAVGLAAAVLAGMATGLGLAWYGLRQPPLHGLRIETRATTASRAAQRLRHGFIVAQVALALVLLSGAGVLLLSLRNAMAVAPGFRADHVLTGHVRIGGPAHQGHAAALAFTDQLLQEIARSPGVRSVALATNVPLSGQSMKSSATVKSDARPRGTPHAIYSYGVTGDYFAAMGLPVRAGRALSSADTATRARVCVVDESFARRYWPGGNAIGQQLWQGGAAGGDDELFTVVGVVGDVKQAAVTDATPQGAVYYTLAHRRDDEAFIVVRTAAAPEPFAAVLRQVVRRLDADLPIDDLQSMDGRIAESLVARRSPALLAMVFAMLAVLLTAIGTYGVLGYAVAQRRREIGLRMALGAQPSQVRRHFLVMAVRLIGAGIGFGVPTAWLTGGAFEAVLFQVPASHPAMLAGSAVVVGLVSLVACVIPSHRAARTPSLAALLDE